MPRLMEMEEAAVVKQPVKQLQPLALLPREHVTLTVPLIQELSVTLPTQQPRGSSPGPSQRINVMITGELSRAGKTRRGRVTNSFGLLHILASLSARRFATDDNNYFLTRLASLVAGVRRPETTLCRASNKRYLP